MNHNTYKEPKHKGIMVMKLHLHANIPHDIDKPNAALGYLKSFLSPEKIHVTNIYWYLMPREIIDLISVTLASLQSTYIHTSHLTPLFTAYISRFFYRVEPEKVEHVPIVCIAAIHIFPGNGKGGQDTFPHPDVSLFQDVRPYLGHGDL